MIHRFFLVDNYKCCACVFARYYTQKFYIIKTRYKRKYTIEKQHIKFLFQSDNFDILLLWLALRARGAETRMDRTGGRKAVPGVAVVLQRDVGGAEVHWRNGSPGQHFFVARERSG